MGCIKGKKHKQMSFNDRLKMEALLKAGHTPKEIADQLGFHFSTIYREKKRGVFIARTTEEEYEERYSPDIAQAHKNEVLAAKGPDLKIGKEHEFARRIEEIICEDDYSPAAALAQMKKEGFEFTICTTTLYSYIDKGVFLNLTNKQLPVKRKDEKRQYRHVEKQARASKGDSIEKRPKEVDGREDFGHWEMDTVVGKQGVSKKSLLVLTERKTRKEIIFLLKHHTTKEVVRALNRLEKRTGDKRFREIFKSITVDNGSEFQDYEGMESSRRNKRKRTKVYYCHPYSSYERGSNENQNKLIRRHVPKGTDLDYLTQREVDRIEEWINAYPRKLFDYRSADELFEEELAKIA
ncbi:MAG: IS30 family transposase [Eubacterium sp.]|nr:IS30 family transposase [Eubacterium sp.]